MNHCSRSRPRERNRGAVAVQVAMGMSVLLGMAAMVVDGGLMMAERRRAQATADAAALAAATDLYKNYGTNTGTDPGGTAASSALSLASKNGYANDGSTTVVSVNIPPVTAKSAYFNGRAGYAEVNVTYKMSRGFSGIWGNSQLTLSAHAVARGTWSASSPSLLALNPTNKSIVKDSGNGVLNVVGTAAAPASIWVDSSNGTALTDTNGATMTVTGPGASINIVGGYAGSPTPPPITGAAAIQDPLNYLPEPTNPGSAPAIQHAGSTWTLSPGSYDGPGDPQWPNFGNGDTVILKQASAGNGGIYYLNKGANLQNVSISMDPTTSGGLMFFNEGSGPSQGFSLTGNPSGTINISALTSGPFSGIAYFQSRTSTQDVSVAGNGSFSIIGTFYAAGAGLKVTGNTASPPSVIGSQYIADNITISGNGSVTVDYTKPNAPYRQLYLVE